MNKYITEISLSDFKKLNKDVYILSGDLSDSYRWNKESMNNVIDTIISKYNGPIDTITVALHTLPTAEDIAAVGDTDGDDPLYTLLWDYAYSGASVLVHMIGFSTCSVCVNTDHIYSTRDYWKTQDDSWSVPKNVTDSIYIVHMED